MTLREDSTVVCPGTVVLDVGGFSGDTLGSFALNNPDGLTVTFEARQDFCDLLNFVSQANAAHHRLNVECGNFDAQGFMAKYPQDVQNSISLIKSDIEQLSVDVMLWLKPMVDRMPIKPVWKVEWYQRFWKQDTRDSCSDASLRLFRFAKDMDLDVYRPPHHTDPFSSWEPFTLKAFSEAECSKRTHVRDLWLLPKGVTHATRVDFCPPKLPTPPRSPCGETKTNNEPNDEAGHNAEMMRLEKMRRELDDMIDRAKARTG